MGAVPGEALPAGYLAASPEQIVDGNGVRLRPFQEADLDELVAGCTDPVTQRFVPTLPRPYTHADARRWVAEGAAAAWAGGGAAYAIADPDSDRLLGGASVGRVVPERAQAEVGFWVVPRARRRGVATAATRTLATWAFARGFGRLELLTEPENTASQRVALAAGFQREGVRRGAVVHPDGQRYDLIAWVRLAGDPPGPSPRLLPDLPGGGLADGVVALRPVGPDDADFLHALHGLPDVVASSVPPVAPTPAETALRAARAASRWLAGERADLVIVDAGTGAPAGELGLYYQEPLIGTAMVGYSMLPAWRGRGYATRALRLLCRWAFDEVGVARLTAGTKPDNARSQRVLQRAGFRREGLLRGRLPWQAGERLDDVLFALLPADLAPGGEPA
ncbi:MAG TPA: GNAT family protein [Pilimelia sp.]|nr:GNAT family protein [Pilimelia sp.]